MNAEAIKTPHHSAKALWGGPQNVSILSPQPHYIFLWPNKPMMKGGAPAMLTPVYENIPQELKKYRQWVLWRLEEREGKPTKIPYNPQRPQYKASSTNPKTWGTYEQARKIAQANGFAGVGYVFSKDCPYAGVDLDKCRNPETGVIKAWAKKEIKGLNSYAEISPSATGVKIWVKGKTPPGRRKKGNYEMYSQGRYFTMTGQHLEGTPTSIEPRQTELEALHREILGQEKQEASRPGPSPVLNLTDSEIITRASAAENSNKFDRLFKGDWTGYATQSEADLALCSILTFWTQDPAQIDRIFRTSGLIRDKWDRPTAGSTYGLKTIEKALTSTTETYQGPGFNKGNGGRVGGAGISRVVEGPKERKKPGPASTFHLTDMGNGQRLVARHGRDLRYCYPWGRWLVWDRQRWSEDLTGEVDRRAKATVGSIYAEASQEKNKDQRKEIAQFALRSESGHRRKAMIGSAMSEPGIPILPDEMDLNPWLLNVLNGTLDLKVGELRPHLRGDFITKLAPVEYDPAATCPTWNKFLNRIMAGNQNLMGFLQRVVGYALTGDTREDCLFFLYGLGANGKSTFLETIQALMGDYAAQTRSETLMVKRDGGHIPNDIAALRGSRFVAAVEVEAGRRMAESLVKQITGGDKVTARFMRAEFFEFKPEFKIFLAANHKPVIRGTDNAIWRRIYLIPFTVQIPYEEQDKELPDKLRAELPGVLNWAKAGTLQWLYGGLNPPKEVQAATQEYREEMDVLGDFLNDCCIMAPGANVKAKDLYAAYKKWAETSGEKYPLTQSTFGNTMKERGFDKKRLGAGSKWHRLGIELRGEEDD